MGLLSDVFTNSIKDDDKDDIKNYGNGIYYFPYDNINTFGQSLSKFISDHPELLLITVTDTGGNGNGLGYIVFFKQNK